MAAPAATLQPLTPRAAPTFNGVANTNGIATAHESPRRSSALVALVSVGLGTVLLGGGLLVWKMRDAPASPPIAGTVTTVATLPPPVTAAVPPPPSPVSDAPPETAPPAPPPPASAAAPPAATPPAVSKPRTRPRTPPVSPPPTSKGPDRGF
jgi:hypothetical protein